MKRIFCVTDYGAVADGKALQTAAIQAAIDACFAYGGGEVCVRSEVSGDKLVLGENEYTIEKGKELKVKI